MSSISSNVDLTTKYQRIATEYAKLKAQVPVLKNAFIDEQSKNRHLTEELQAKVANVRKLQSEMESLEFRNEQLLKRVESLQLEVEESQKLRLKHKKSNARNQNISSLSSDGDIDIIKDEFEIKIQENQFLYSKIEEMKADFETKKQALEQRCAELEAELVNAKAEAVGVPENKNNCDQLPTNASEAGEVCRTAPSSSSYQKKLSMSSDDINGTFHAILSDSVQKVHVIIQGFINLLRLFEQRSTVYPNDMVLEPLPENTLVFGQKLLKTIEALKTLYGLTESLCAQVSDDGCELDVWPEVVRFSAVFSEVVQSFQYWSEPFKQCIESENRVSWCGVNLYTSNEEWCKKFMDFLNSLCNLNKLLVDPDEGVAEGCIDILTETLRLVSESSKLYSQKMFDENRLPTASKRLKCLNDCIDKCLGSLQRNLENFILLLKLAVSSYSLKNTVSSAAVDEETDSDLEVGVQKPLTVEDERSSEVISKDGSEDEFNSHLLDAQKNELENELRISKSRIIDLEKERDRLQVENELLKMKVTGGHIEDVAAEPLSHVPSEELHLVISFYDKRVEELATEVQYLQSRASYYQNECAALLQHAQLTETEKDALGEELSATKEEMSRLKDDLDTTQRGYEEQMKNLYEHMSELNTKIESQSEVISSLKSNGIGGIKHGARKLLFK